MELQINITLLCLLAITHASVLPGAANASCSSVTCVPSTGAAHIIVSRASTEAPGTGIIGAVADAVVEACPGSDIAANPYPALLEPYVSSESEGVSDLTDMVTSYQSCCPDSKIVLMGYSQGAQVTADFLCGTSESGFSSTTAYASAVQSVLAAAVLMGDPSFVKGESWDRGNASNVSSNYQYFPRQDNSACDPIASVLISYCDSGDEFCDKGISADALLIHEGYVTEYGDAAASYTVDKIGGCSGLSAKLL